MPAHFIVVGAGYAGLTAAIELSRKGFDVEVFESAKRFTRQGWHTFLRWAISQ